MNQALAQTNEETAGRLLLEPGVISGLEDIPIDSPALLTTYLQNAFTTLIAFLAVASVIIIAYQGVRYSATGLLDKKNEARQQIRNAVLGLILALGSYLILRTINPDLVSLQIISGSPNN